MDQVIQAMMSRFRLSLGLLGFIFCLCLPCVRSGEPLKLAWAETPPDNPLKGLVPYADADVEQFPHSLEFDYVRLGDLMTGQNAFDWKPLEARFDKISSRGCQAVFRIWIEYPNQKTGLPQFLIDEGIEVTAWTNPKESPPTKNYSPDYEDERLVQAIEAFIAEFGRIYDGDPRLGYLTAGLLGEWGEWHNWPREDLFASKQTQLRVLAAYEKGFQKNPVLLRYPAGEGHDTYVANAGRPFGYHDDSFAWGTLETGKSDDSWFYMSLLKQAGPDALQKWQTQPIGGEIRPEVWGQIFDAHPRHKQAQDFAECVTQTHVTWVMDSGMFEQQQSADRIQRATAEVRKMGYDFHVQTASIERTAQGDVAINLSVVNQGVAPFYHDWSLEVAAFGPDGAVLKTFPVDWKLGSILPSQPPHAWTTKLTASEIPAGTQKLGLRVINPLSNGKSLCFANAAQNADAPGWLTLGARPENAK